MLLEPPNTCYSNVLNHGVTLNIENSNDLKLLGKQDTGAQESFSADPDNVFSKWQTFSEESNKLVMFLIGKIRYLTRNDTLLKKKKSVVRWEENLTSLKRNTIWFVNSQINVKRKLGQDRPHLGSD